MNKIIALLSISTILFTSYAQDSKINVGIEAGIIRSFPWAEDVSDASNPLYSVSPGINIEYILIPVFSLKTGLIYEKKGWSTEYFFVDTDGYPIGAREYTTNFDYLTIPLLLSYSTKGKICFYVNSGIYIGFLLSNNVILSAYGDHSESVVDVSEDTKRIDFGLSIGCGLSIPIGQKFGFDFGLRDNIGMIDMFIPENNSKARFNTLGLIMSMKYRL